MPGDRRLLGEAVLTIAQLDESLTCPVVFAPPGSLYLLGATAGRQARQMLVLMHEVKVGMRMELGVGDLAEKNREITGEVKAIKLGG